MPSSVCISASYIGTFDVVAISSGMEALLLHVKVSRLVLLPCVKSTVVCHLVFVLMCHAHVHSMLVQSQW